jgi:hypothetical protein
MAGQVSREHVLTVFGDRNGFYVLAVLDHPKTELLLVFYVDCEPVAEIATGVLEISADPEAMNPVYVDVAIVFGNLAGIEVKLDQLTNPRC